VRLIGARNVAHSLGDGQAESFARENGSPGRPFLKKLYALKPEPKTEPQNDDRIATSTARLFGQALFSFEIHFDHLKQVVDPTREWSPEADSYIFSHLSQAVDDCLLMLWYEAGARSSTQQKLGRKDVQRLMNLYKEMVKERLGARGRGGSDYSTWPPERCVDFQRVYESAHERVRKAKRLYTDNKKGEWSTIIRRMDRKLPQWLIDRLPLKGEKPSDLARELAAELFGVPHSSYLKVVLHRAALHRQAGYPQNHNLKLSRPR
jgi:hypothetical protein